MIRALAVAILLSVLHLPATAAQRTPPQWKVRRTVPLGKAWAGHPVGFVFRIRGDQEYAGWYDANRVMTFAQRKVGSDQWTIHKTKERTGWDSHNNITLAFDSAGHLHVAANMHCSPLHYWRSEKPEDITTLKPVHRMTGREIGCTYPLFMHDKAGRLVFMLRIGGSGNGRRYVNVYDEKTRAWSRLVDQPVVSGVGGNQTMNAYPFGFRTDANGVFHMAFVWRDTPDCSTNHDVCYARSRDLKHWETSTGKPLPLPLTMGNAEVVDPVPARGGLLNNIKLGFDAQDRPLIAYHKFDKDGHTQLHLARREKTGWRLYQTTQWIYRWYFKGGGCIKGEIGYSGPRLAPDGRNIVQSYRHIKHGSAARLLDGDTLKPIGKAPSGVRWPAVVRRVESNFPGMRVNLRTAERDGTTYVLRWETLGPNRDRPRPKDQTPPPGPLVFYELAPPPAK